jgi:hypothetical protein
MVFTRHPQPFTAPLGDEVYFECSLNLAAEKFAWRHRPLGSSEWILLDAVSVNGGKTSKYVVYFDDESKAGDYRCIAFYGKYARRETSSVRLTKEERLEPRLASPHLASPHLASLISFYCSRDGVG